MTNYQLITSGFQTLRASLAPFIARELIKTYGNYNWWKDGVWNRLYDYQRRSIPEDGSYDELVDALDIANCLLLIDINWRNIFRHVLSQDCRSLVYELRSARNKWAHFGGEQPTPRTTWRTLDTMSMLCMEIDPDGTAEIEELLGEIENDAQPIPAKPKESAVGLEQEKTPAPPMTKTSPSQNTSWRFMPKGRWTKAALDIAVAKWCEENQRTPINGFDELGFSDAAEAALAMPMMDDSRANSFRDAADSVIFLINDAKMTALTVAADGKGQLVETTEKVDGKPGRIETIVAETGVREACPTRKERFDAYERFVHIPKKKASWTRDDILEIADSWAEEHSRSIPAQVWQWQLDTLADMVLSRFPEQSDPSISFNSSLPETLFAPNTRKLYIMTHM